MRSGWALWLLLVLGCAPRKAVSSANERSSDGPATGFAITLERTACFGACPVYSISVSRDGTITYEGRAHVRHLGAATAQISPERVTALLSELEKAGYFSFAGRYTPAEPACGRYSTDSPSTITSVQIRGRTKRIEHDYGCGSVPGALTVMEQRIDEVLGSGRWTGR
jgi:hypothetical protein